MAKQTHSFGCHMHWVDLVTGDRYGDEMLSEE